MTLTPNDSSLSQKKKKTPIYWLSYSKYEVKNINVSNTKKKWILVSSINKIFYCRISDSDFELHLLQKSIGVLI